MQKSTIFIVIEGKNITAYDNLEEARKVMEGKEAELKICDYYHNYTYTLGELMGD